MKSKKMFGFLLSLLIVFCTFLPATKAEAKALDEILDYTIYVSVNEDATLNITYFIDWKVLDSTSEGPLEWVKVGVPNKKYTDLTALTDNIKSVSKYSSGGTYARIDFKKKYYKDEVVSFAFSIVQDYMYEMNKNEEGYTVYTFTPGWFDDIAVDNLTIYWAADKAETWSPSAINDGTSIMFNKTDMKAGDKLTVSVTYPNDAFAFNTEVSEGYAKNQSTGSTSSGSSDSSSACCGAFAVLFCFGTYFTIIGLIVKSVYNRERGLGAATTKKVITRTRVEYYPTCPGCGGARSDGEKDCRFCGRSLVKSEEKVTETDEEAKKYSEEGEFRSSTSPHVYYHVHVATVPVPRPRSTTSHHSSCAHSSCACACACACAGGGRAGCSVKGFYSVSLKREQLRRKKK